MEVHSKSREKTHHASLPLLSVFSKHVLGNFRHASIFTSGDRFKGEPSTGICDFHSVCPRAHLGLHVCRVPVFGCRGSHVRNSRCTRWEICGGGDVLKCRVSGRWVYVLFGDLLTGGIGVGWFRGKDEVGSLDNNGGLMGCVCGVKY